MANGGAPAPPAGSRPDRARADMAARWQPGDSLAMIRQGLNANGPTVARQGEERPLHGGPHGPYARIRKEAYAQRRARRRHSDRLTLTGVGRSVWLTPSPALRRCSLTSPPSIPVVGPAAAPDPGARPARAGGVPRRRALCRQVQRRARGAARPVGRRRARVRHRLDRRGARGQGAAAACPLPLHAPGQERRRHRRGLPRPWRAPVRVRPSGRAGQDRGGHRLRRGSRAVRAAGRARRGCAAGADRQVRRRRRGCRRRWCARRAATPSWWA